MKKKRPKLVWIVMVPGEKWGFGFSRRKYALWFRRSVQRDWRTRPSLVHREVCKRLRLVRVVMQAGFR